MHRIVAGAALAFVIALSSPTSTLAVRYSGVVGQHHPGYQTCGFNAITVDGATLGLNFGSPTVMGERQWVYLRHYLMRFNPARNTFEYVVSAGSAIASPQTATLEYDVLGDNITWYEYVGGAWRFGDDGHQFSVTYPGVYTVLTWFEWISPVDNRTVTGTAYAYGYACQF